MGCSCFVTIQTISKCLLSVTHQDRKEHASTHRPAMPAFWTSCTNIPSSPFSSLRKPTTLKPRLLPSGLKSCNVTTACTLHVKQNCLLQIKYFVKMNVIHYCSRTFLICLFLRIAGVSYGRFMATHCRLICQCMFRTVGDR